MSSKRSADQLQGTPAQSTELLQELVADLRQNRTQLREEWAKSIAEARLLTAMVE
jgi:rsbT co-antagonist protein RsbR